MSKRERVADLLSDMLDWESLSRLESLDIADAVIDLIEEENS